MTFLNFQLNIDMTLSEKNGLQHVTVKLLKSSTTTGVQDLLLDTSFPAESSEKLSRLYRQALILTDDFVRALIQAAQTQAVGAVTKTHLEQEPTSKTLRQSLEESLSQM